MTCIFGYSKPLRSSITLFAPRLNVSDDEMIVVGMAMGYPDLDKVGRFNCAPQKHPVSDIAEFLGFDEA